MQMALNLARKGEGETSPNPMVGAIVVQNGRVVGQGYHSKAGGPHAEVVALRKAGKRARGANLFVNLEPCCHYGKTPPCVDIILQAGIKNIYVGMRDPNPLVLGKGLRVLRQNGVKTETGILREACVRLNETFVKYIVKKKPFVILKSAVSLDGKIATHKGESKWITGESSRKRVHVLRNQVDAILVGAGTILQDDPELTVRLRGRKRNNPARIILDDDHRTKLSARVFQNAGRERVIYVSSTEPSFTRKKQLRSMAVEVNVFGFCGEGIDWLRFLDSLARSGITSLLIEGGGQVNASALSAKVIDKVIFFIAPILIGGASAPGAIGGEGTASLFSASQLKNIFVIRVGDDVMVEGYL